MPNTKDTSYLLEKIWLYLLRGRVPIPDNAGNEDISYYLDKIATTLADYGGIIGAGGSERLDALENTVNQILAEVVEIENHLHSDESWFETAATPSGQTNVADRVSVGGGSFQIDAGNDDWGAWVQILGSADTPARTGMTLYDLHRLEISAAEQNEVYFVQIGFGASGADALTNGDYTEAVFKPSSNQIDSGPVVVQTERHAAGTLAWARCMCPGQNTATLNFFVGLHEYAE